MVVIAHQNESGAMDAASLHRLAEPLDELGDDERLLEGVIAGETTDSIDDVEVSSLLGEDVLAGNSRYFWYSFRPTRSGWLSR